MDKLSRIIKHARPQSQDAVIEARVALREAIARLAIAREHHADAVAARQRVRDLVESVQTADAEVDRLEERLKQAGRDWAASGADPAKVPLEHAIQNELDTARRRAANLRVLGAGAEQAADERVNALDQTNEEKAQSAIESAQSEIRAAVQGVLLAVVEPQLRQMETAKAAYLKAFVEARALLLALRGKRHSFSGNGAVILEQRLRDQMLPATPLDNDLQPLSHRWKELAEQSQTFASFGEALMNDPDAPVPTELCVKDRH